MPEEDAKIGVNIHTKRNGEREEREKRYLSL